MSRIVGSLRARMRPGTRLAQFEDRRFDRRLGIDTQGMVEPATLTVAQGDPSSGFTYVATSVRLARWWLNALPGDPASFTFVDMGSGKGRVLALAAEHGFRHVVGIEFAAELHDAAVANARAAAERGVHFEPRLGDAGRFEFPDGALVVHFNNPFAEAVMEQVIANLTRAYDEARPALVVVYQRLTVEEERHDTSNLDLLGDVRFLRRRTLEPTGWLDSRLLSAYTVQIFESPEAIALSPSAPR